MSEVKAIIKNADMSEGTQQRSIDCARDAMTQFTVAKEIAAYIKKEFDSTYGPIWHCVVGRQFGSYLTHEARHFIFFYMNQMAILIFKAG
ncbi:dynein light chain [Echinococcus multilocularis]|uniref:Dynein light chain n=1 Tax=Echinococcus multilocularis TaxID=6211 RepID=A0A068YHM6_ECHMU|nr:dynein light chain [Echinococcus multilocularis]